jgi:hypothetical protein
VNGISGDELEEEEGGIDDEQDDDTRGFGERHVGEIVAGECASRMVLFGWWRLEVSRSVN